MSLDTLSTYSQHIPFLIGLYTSYKLKFDRVLWNFFIVLAFLSVLELLNSYMQYLNLPNTPIMNFATPIYTLLYLNLFKSSKLLSIKWYWILVILLLLGWPILSYINPTVTTFNSKLIIYTNFLLMIAIAFTLIEMINGDIPDLFLEPLFWICITTMTFFTSSVVVYSFIDLSISNSDFIFPIEIWYIHSVLNILCNLIMSYAFICKIRSNSSILLS